MSTFYSMNTKGQLVAFDTLNDAKVGRWCDMSAYPDRCYCWNPTTMLHGHATHYVLRRGLNMRYSREGRCLQCADKRGGGKLHKIPEAK